MDPPVARLSLWLLLAGLGAVTLIGEVTLFLLGLGGYALSVPILAIGLGLGYLAWATPKRRTPIAEEEPFDDPVEEADREPPVPPEGSPQPEAPGSEKVANRPADSVADAP